MTARRANHLSILCPFLDDELYKGEACLTKNGIEFFLRALLFYVATMQKITFLRKINIAVMLFEIFVLFSRNNTKSPINSQ